MPERIYELDDATLPVDQTANQLVLDQTGNSEAEKISLENLRSEFDIPNLPSTYPVINTPQAGDLIAAEDSLGNRSHIDYGLFPSSFQNWATNATFTGNLVMTQNVAYSDFTQTGPVSIIYFPNIADRQGATHTVVFQSDGVNSVTFASEVIPATGVLPNLEDGNEHRLRFTLNGGAVIVEEAITATSSNASFGEMLEDNFGQPATSLAITASVYSPIISLTGNVTVDSNLLSFNDNNVTGDEIVVGSNGAGQYSMAYGGSFDGGNRVKYAMSPFVNGVRVSDANAIAQTDNSSEGASMSRFKLVDLVAGDVVTLQVTAESNVTTDIFSAYIVINRVGA